MPRFWRQSDLGISVSEVKAIRLESCQSWLLHTTPHDHHFSLLPIYFIAKLLCQGLCFLYSKCSLYKDHFSALAEGE